MAASSVASLPGDNAPSKVLHVRNLPEECSQEDLRSLCGKFGHIAKVLHLSRQHQAFIEFSSVEEAAEMLLACAEAPMRLGMRVLMLQFSNKQEITTPQRDAAGRAPAKEKASHRIPPGGSGKVLLVTVTNIVWPVDADIMMQVFASLEMQGSIEKMVTFTKQGKTQALVQFSNTHDAAAALERFHGQNIYSNCNTLSLQYSNLDEVVVKFSNERSRDYTNPNLPTINPNKVPERLGGASISASPARTPAMGAPFFSPLAGQKWGDVSSPADLARGAGLSAAGVDCRGGLAVVGGLEAVAAGLVGLALGGGGMMRVTPVILVNNLDPDRVTPTALFNLFSMSGVVARVKILYNKRDTALIQFESGEHAANARRTLSGCPLWGRNILISQSKFNAVQANRSDLEEETSMTLFGDFSICALHRYKGAAGRNIPTIEPCKLLHVSNVPSNLSEDDLKDIFVEHGIVQKIKFINSKATDASHDRKMALVELSTVQDAAEAICEKHNTIVEGTRLRVSFSTSNLDGVR